MYDLPSEALEEPGLPDEFHDLQPQLLSRTLRLSQYATGQFFTGSDLNLYYDSAHPQWYKRPDWFLSVDVPRLYQGDLRRSYVIWQERRAPFVVVEFLSPGTEKEDLGPYAESATAPLGTILQTDPLLPTTAQPVNGQALDEKTPAKWTVYEQILRVPYYIVFSRYTDTLRFFQLVGGHYQEQSVDQERPRLWLPELNIGLGLWQGEFEGISRLWLRWYDAQDAWIGTDTEQALEQAEQALERAEQERCAKEQALQRANQAEAQIQQVARNLLQAGSSIAQVSQLTGLAEDQVKQLQAE
ncbi:MAG: Uma2 family endonuclease [Lyngbya sp. HA4199-MV5]|nr:Uma2 family endonuclease [Lyngbya sp. HA4199-MV5]